MVLACFFGAFTLTLLASSIFTPVQPSNAQDVSTTITSGGYTIKLTSASLINMNISPTADGVYASAKDTLNVKTNAQGYKLYLATNLDEANANRLYLNGQSTSSEYINPASGTVDTPEQLGNNSWGFALTNGTGGFDSSYDVPTPLMTSKWAAVPLPSNAAVIFTANDANQDPGDNIDIYYGAKVNTALAAGVYSNVVNYTAVANGAATDIAAISPSVTDQIYGGIEATITTTLSVTAANAGEVFVKIGDADCTNATTSNGPSGNLIIKCLTPSLPSGFHNVTVNIPTYNKTYYISNGIEYRMPQMKSMQEMDFQTCQSMPLETPQLWYDNRDGNSYVVQRLKDGNCWMTQNLNLGKAGEDLVLKPTDSDVSVETVIPGSNIYDQTGTAFTANDYGIFDNSSTIPRSGNLYNYFAATAGSGTAELASANAADSVCPKGWRLPSGRDNNTSFENLFTLGGYTANMANAQKSPINLQRAGYFTSVVNAATTYVGLWTSTAYTNAGYSMALTANDEGFNKNTYIYKRQGYSVRCVYTGNRMQDTNFIKTCKDAVTGTIWLMVDIRDNNTYTVRKMEDDNCWMTQNLRLGDKKFPLTLTSADTDISTSFTIPIANVQNSGTTAWNNTIARVYNNGNAWIQPTSAGNDATVNTTGLPQSQSQYIGNYYNWYTATTGTGTDNLTSGNATSSICPKGWKLPTGSDFTGLTGALVNITTNTNSVPDATFTLQSAPNHFILSGFYRSGIYNQGIWGGWWSSSVDDTLQNYAINMYLSTSDVYPQSNGDALFGSKADGGSVRCIMPVTSEFYFIETMQEMNSTICAAARVNDERILRDTRDGNTYTIRKMPDNNCWMTQNLRLGSTSADITLTPADSDVTADFTIPSSAVQTSGSTSWSTSLGAIHVYSNGDAWIQPTSSGSSATVNTSGTPPNQSQYIGNYYNWYTATASTGTADMTSSNASSSICPKGWKLPADNTANDRFSDLTIALGVTENAAGSWTLQNSPGHFVLSGLYRSSVESQGDSGYWWSSAAHYSNSSLAYSLQLGTTSFYGHRERYKYDGLSVRCIVK